MAHEFNTELTAQEEWGWLLALDLFFGGLGGGLFLLFLLFGLSSSIAVLSLVFVALGAVVLMVELGHPLRAWRALCKPFSSWISRGVFFVTFFIVFGALYSASGFDSFVWLAPGSDAAKSTIAVIAGLSALMVTLYPGFVLAASPSIPFWSSPLLPVIFCFHSLMVASGLLFLIAPLGLEVRALQSISYLGAILIIANFVLGAMYLAASKKSGLAAKESVRRLNKGSLGWTFNLGVVLIGMVVPLLLVLWSPPAIALAGAGLFILIGGLLFRYCVLKAGVYVPFALT
ncbi:MAG: polysulfide reductase NrfD [Deltaproteobacteria bacterium]|nr:polysulfide reductase NrfD [Deltaproteobacteria bacterium]